MGLLGTAGGNIFGACDYQRQGYNSGSIAAMGTPQLSRAACGRDLAHKSDRCIFEALARLRPS